MVDSWRSYIKDIDLVICDGNSFGLRAEDIRLFGKPVLCASKASFLFNNMFEEKTKDLLKKRGLNFDKIEDGLSLRAHVFFNGRRFIKPIFYSLEGNGNVVFASGRPSRVKEDILDKLEQLLIQIRYRGLVNIQYQINNSEYCIEDIFLGISDILDPLIEILKEDITDVLFEVATGIKNRVDVKCKFLITIPYKMQAILYPLLIDGINDKNKKHIALNSVSVNKDKYYYNSNNQRAISITARGDSINEAQRRVYRTVKNIKINGAKYRQNVGELAKHKLQKLQEIAFL
jgi:hypothetical protein